VKWYQYLFSKQWKELRDYCRQLDIELFGDMPIYISHDSVDVWTNPRIFSIDEEGTPVMWPGCHPTTSMITASCGYASLQLGGYERKWLCLVEKTHKKKPGLVRSNTS
jgi:hypothetical protein